MAQLLIDMPAESAARLLTLSLLEQLSLHAVPIRVAPTNGVRDTPVVVPRGDAYRAALNRLRGCIAIYDEILGASISKKARRSLRSSAKAANGLHDADAQLAWLSQAARDVARPEPKPNDDMRPASGDGNETVVGSDAVDAPHNAASHVARVSAQGALAAHWLGDRIARRRERLVTQLAQAQEDTRPLRRLAKRLSVYTTAIRLSDMADSMSFAELTGKRLADASSALRAGLAELTKVNDTRGLRRVQRAADHVAYLLDAVRSVADVGDLATTAHELRAAIASLRDSAVVADALIESGRRIGALQMMTRLRRTVWPCGVNGTDGAEPNATSRSVLPDEMGPGLLSLAESLRDECAQSFDVFSSRWLSADNDEFFNGLEHVATRLGAR